MPQQTDVVAIQTTEGYLAGSTLLQVLDNFALDNLNTSNRVPPSSLENIGTISVSH